MSKNIVVFCDGTWNSPNSMTNVFALSNEVIDQDYKQHVKYMDGVGVGEIGLKFIIDGIMAVSLDNKVKEAYKFIVSHYKPGDDIWLFGFSRGAYTVRSVVGLIRNCGILKFDRTNQDISQLDQIVNLAYNIYRNRNSTYHPDGSGADDFRKSFSYPDSDKPPVKFLGLWDTVGAHGIPGYTIEKGFEYLEFFDSVVPNVVRYARQALAIHERRSFFEPCRILTNSTSTVDIKESWFPGVHMEVGGGTSLTSEGNERISKATMLWMIENIVEVGGLLMRDTIENYRKRYSPNSGSTWSLKSLIFDRNFSFMPAVLLKDRKIPLITDDDKPEMLKHGLLYRDSDWIEVFGDRKNLKSQYVSNTYENLRKDMEYKGIRLYDNVKYEEAEKAHL